VTVGHIADVRSYGDRETNHPGLPRVYVQDKMNRNWTNYPAGHVTIDASWVNMWTGPKYADLGWRGPTKGNGIKELGQMLARSEAFANCMTTRVFKHVCLREPEGNETSELNGIARSFESDMRYSMKSLIAKVSSQPACLGEQ